LTLPTQLIYEFKKGIRDLVLWSVPKCRQRELTERLTRAGIPYVVREVSKNKVNVYFGRVECLEIVKGFGDKPLNQFTHEEDFILGIMLGYSRSEQYGRYRKRKLASASANSNKA
jgi:hypothetical protein